MDNFMKYDTWLYDKFWNIFKNSVFYCAFQIAFGLFWKIKNTAKQQNKKNIITHFLKCLKKCLWNIFANKLFIHTEYSVTVELLIGDHNIKINM